MKLAIWGAGEYGKQAVAYIEKTNDLEIVVIGDGNPQKTGTNIGKNKVVSCEEFEKKFANADKVLIAIARWEGAIQTLLSFKIKLEDIMVWSQGRIQKIKDMDIANYYSQDGEEIYLKARFGDNYKGTYVDVGAFHPYRYSNTAWAYENGWRGINIEPNPDSFYMFEIFRPEDKNYNCGISQSGGEIKYHMFDEAALNTFNEELYKYYVEKGCTTIGTKKIITRPLKDILDECGIKNIDYIDIDTEEYEMEVLNSIDFSRVDIKCILIEQFGNIDEILGSDITLFLQKQGYHINSKYNRTVIYEK